MKGAAREGAARPALGWGGRRAKNEIEVLQGKKEWKPRPRTLHDLLKRDYALSSGAAQ